MHRLRDLELAHDIDRKSSMQDRHRLQDNSSPDNNRPSPLIDHNLRPRKDRNFNRLNLGQESRNILAVRQLTARFAGYPERVQLYAPASD